MKYLPLLLLFFASCTSEREIMDSWLGHEKKEVILKWGPPQRTTSDGNSGEVLVYSNQYAYNYQPYWKHTMFYINPSGKVYYWMVQKNAIPPTQVIIR